MSNTCFATTSWGVCKHQTPNEATHQRKPASFISAQYFMLTTVSMGMLIMAVCLRSRAKKWPFPVFHSLLTLSVVLQMLGWGASAAPYLSSFSQGSRIREGRSCRTHPGPWRIKKKVKKTNVPCPRLCHLLGSVGITPRIHPWTESHINKTLLAIFSGLESGEGWAWKDFCTFSNYKKFHLSHVDFWS